MEYGSLPGHRQRSSGLYGPRFRGGLQLKRGDRVKVRLPPGVEAWGEYGPEWSGMVIYVNGDSIDVEGPRGTVEPVDREYVTLERKRRRS